LAGHSNNSFERQQKQVSFAKKHGVIVVLKGAHTCTALPDGTLYFNSSGNPALATAGSGDILTGIITSLLAQQYTMAQAAVLGVHVHGLCADLWVKQGKQTMIAGDIIDMLPQGLQSIAQY
jgi:ADP-dependent NAD(P)H-hydrate dehydratase / NAD(P)H-hydrate epimerase